MPDGYNVNTRAFTPAAPHAGPRGILSALRRLDLYVGRSWPGVPRFGLVREPGSLEVNALAWTAILSWAPVVVSPGRPATLATGAGPQRG